MKYKKTDKIIKDIIEIDTVVLELSDEKLIKYLDYMIQEGQIYRVFPIGYKIPFKHISVEHSVLKDINNFVNVLNNYFEKFDCDEYIEFLHDLIFN